MTTMSGGRATSMTEEGKANLELAESTVVSKSFLLPDFDDPNICPEDAVIENDSPYPEVRSAVANIDDPGILVSTLRSWTIGFIWAIVFPGMNQLFFFRYPSVVVGGIVTQLLSFPLGKAWERCVPGVKVFGISLNPGPFSIKEHVLITIMANVGTTSAYAIDVVAVQRVFYHQTYNFGYQWMVVMSTQLIGFSIGGIAQRCLVQPPSMIWPANLVTCALFNTLHSQRYAGVGTRGGISRERFFVYGFLGSTVWYFFPGYIFQALSYFSWVCWIVPNDVPINQMFGYQHGMGMSLITFDWGQIAYIGSPLATPWWVEMNVTAGFILFFWFITPILYYTNTWEGSYMPISSHNPYDHFGERYNISRIFNADFTFNESAYRTYSPLYLSTTLAISYGLSFASVTATLTHAFLFFRKQIWVQSRGPMDEHLDIHARLMRKYPQVPEWWYAVIFASTFVFGIVSIELWHSHLPVWAFVLALFIALLYVIPVGMIQAMTNQQIRLNVITELIIGYALPGKPLAMMLFKTWGYITMTQALQFSSDFKIGHYMKIPPRTMFLAKVIGTVIAGTVQLGVQTWVFANIADICDSEQSDGFTCPKTEVFGAASVLWGVIGPARLFSRGQVYYALTSFFLVGVVCPLVNYLILLKFPGSWLRYVNFPVIFSGSSSTPPASGVNYVPWALVGFVFQYVVRRRHFSWWTKYNYVLSAALDSGVAVAVVLIFFCLQYPQSHRIVSSSVQTWWGNTIFTKNADWKGTPLKVIKPGEKPFGPSVW